MIHAITNKKVSNTTFESFFILSLKITSQKMSEHLRIKLLSIPDDQEGKNEEWITTLQFRMERKIIKTHARTNFLNLFFRNWFLNLFFEMVFELYFLELFFKIVFQNCFSKLFFKIVF